MILITNKNDNSILNWGKTLSYLDNGYPILVEENTAFIPDEVEINEVESMSPDVQIGKHCYTEKDGFYLNPNWVEPNKYGLPDELVQTIQADYTEELIEGGII